MLATPMDILKEFPVRKSKAQKQAFRTAVQAYVQKQGYNTAVENGRFGVRNLVIGDPEKADYLVTAHYDTPARSPFPNFCTPCNFALGLLRTLAMYLAMFAVGIIVSVVAALVVGEWILPWAAVGSILCMDGLLLLGPANLSNVNDNSSGVITLLEIVRTLPENQRHKVCFVLFDLEEAGLIGSGVYRKAHKAATDRQLVLNLDCVGDGDHIRLFPTKKLLKDRKKCTSLYKACGYFGKKDILVHEKRLCKYNSDQRRFPYGVGICALNRKKKLLYLSRIHTSKDTVLDINNVNILRAALTTFICRDAVN